MISFRIIVFIVGLSWTCNLQSQTNPLFRELNPRSSGIKFKNIITENQKHNALTYENLYNGGGVAVGDINNDGLDDIYFISNMEEDALYLNQGNMKFKDITKKALPDKAKGWKTGVAMVDVNGDHFLDIYVCYSGKSNPEQRRNKLYINQGDLTFVEEAEQYGLADDSYTTQAAFFDYDKDGDLDVFILATNVEVIKSFKFGEARNEIHPYAGDKLFRNDEGRFIEVTQSAGILSNALGFGLGVSISDINKDGWLDIYVSNDYVEPDYLYINNGDGSFSDKMSDYLMHISHFSMGSDISDINNDGWPDLLTLDMLPADNKRQKLLYGPENYEVFALQIEEGYYFQNMRNMLHLNNAVGRFSEIGQLAGISNTDWSWAPLIVDLDNDGWKDIFITNGYFKDYTNQDFLKYKGDYFFEKAIHKEVPDTFELVQSMTSTPLHNYIFRNNGDLTFEDKSEPWGFSKPSFSNGAAYSDLDGDGDIDLVVNNQNDFARIYENTIAQQKQKPHFVALELQSSQKNTKGWGAKVEVHLAGKILYGEQMPIRGYQSTVTDVLHFGLGNESIIDSIVVYWLEGGYTIEKSPLVDQVITLADSNKKWANDSLENMTLSPVFTKMDDMMPYQHKEYSVNDFKRQPLLSVMLSPVGPVFEVADLNGDGLEDVFIGGSKGETPRLFFQNRVGKFTLSPPNGFDKDVDYADSDVAIYDVDQDGDLDILLASGGYHDYVDRDTFFQDRLYLNNGKGKFELDSTRLPRDRGATSFVKQGDFDGDGYPDLLLGGGIVPGQYPLSYPTKLLRYRDGRYEEVPSAISAMQVLPGWAKDGDFVDFNGDGLLDIVLCGPFMPLTILLQTASGEWINDTDKYFGLSKQGWWTTLKVHDFDGDGDLDILAGNFGLNSQLCASSDQPMTLLFKDFDGNGSIDPILSCYNQGISYPFASRDELQNQIYSLRSQFTSYEEYSERTINEIFSRDQLKDAITWQINELKTVYFENQGGLFVEHSLPIEAQFAPVEAIQILDYNDDEVDDFILVGNQSSIRLRLGVIDANMGQLFEGNGASTFRYIPQAESGLDIVGDAKSIGTVVVKGQPMLWVGVNNFGMVYFKYNER